MRLEQLLGHADLLHEQRVWLEEDLTEPWMAAPIGKAEARSILEAASAVRAWSEF